MKLSRALVVSACLCLVAGAYAQDSLLGKTKGGGGGGQGSNPPRQQSSSGSRSSGGRSSASSRSDDFSFGQSKNQDNLLGKQRVQSRSGRVHYGTMNNLLNQQTRQRPKPIFQAPSRNDLNTITPSMREQIRREDRTRVYQDSRFRVGYYQYNQSWRDDFFTYPYYVFDPYMSGQCVVSPWYYYPYLPGYIDVTRIVFTSNYDNSFVGFPYDYQPPSRYRDDDDGYGDRDRYYDRDSFNRRNLDYTIDDIVQAFTRGDRRAVDRLVPRYGSVSVSVDGRVSYGLNVNDFYDMLMDAVTSSRTIAYEILSVKAGDDEAEVLARHDYLDPWGERQSVYHRYHLFLERGNIVIRYFESDADPNW